MLEAVTAPLETAIPAGVAPVSSSERISSIDVLLRIPTKKIIHSELKKIILSLSDAGKNIVEQVIVIGQGKMLHNSGNPINIISFLLA